MKKYGIPIIIVQLLFWIGYALASIEGLNPSMFVCYIFSILVSLFVIWGIYINN